MEQQKEKKWYIIAALKNTRLQQVKGMVKLKFWDKDSDKVRHGDYIYKQPS